jgi:acetyltransferase-like isoleucine patch superfamily enzyme
MKRNFGNESAANFLMRASRALSGRLRAGCFRLLGLFHEGTGRGLYFGHGARFINSKGILLSSQVHFGVLARLECHGEFQKGASPKISVGRGTSFGDYCHIGAANGVIIGTGVLGGSGITIIDHNHGSPRADLSGKAPGDPKKRELVSKGPIVIEDNVWIGDGVIILPGCVVGKGAIIAANVVVTKNVASGSIYIGPK